MKLLILIGVLFFSSFAFAQSKLFKSIPNDHAFLIKAKSECEKSINLRFCAEFGNARGEIELFCNPNKYNCTENKNLFTLKQYVLDESRLSEECLISLEISKVYKNGMLASYYVTSEIHPNCEA